MRPIYMPLAGLALMAFGACMMETALTVAMLDWGAAIARFGCSVTMMGCAYVLGRMHGAADIIRRNTEASHARVRAQSLRMLETLRLRSKEKQGAHVDHDREDASAAGLAEGLRGRRGAAASGA